MDPEEHYELVAQRPWARAVAALLIVALIVGSGFYLRGLFLGDDPSASDGSFAEADRLDRPARTVPCGPTGAAEPVTDAPAPEQLTAIADNVEVLRGLAFETEVSSEFLPPAEVAAEVDELNEEFYSPKEIERDEIIARMLGLIPRGGDLGKILEAVSSQVAGFYDPSDGRMVVNAADPTAPLSVASELTLAHELEHALADQNFGLPEADEVAGPLLDKALAERSLFEGDATLLQQHYAATAIRPGEAAEIFDDPMTEQALRELEDLPYPVRRAFEFPYTFGLSFVCELYAEGGWDAVDDAYADPPTTTAQVLFPERYRTQESAWPIRAVEGPIGWAERENASVGAADLLLLFEAPGSIPSKALSDPLSRAAAWVGGRLQLWSESRRSNDGLLLMSLLQRSDGHGLCASIQAWYLKAFPGEIVDTRAAVDLAVAGDEQDAAVTCEGRSVKVAIGPDMETVLSSLGNPTATAAR